MFSCPEEPVDDDENANHPYDGRRVVCLSLTKGPHKHHGVKPNLLMFEPVTGNTAGRSQKIRHIRAKPTVKTFAIQPKARGNLKVGVVGSKRAGLPRASSKAAGNANVMSCKMRPVPINALKAVEEPRYTHPMRKTTKPFAQSAQTGASRREFMMDSLEENIKPVSRAKAQVSLEAVWR